MEKYVNMLVWNVWSIAETKKLQNFLQIIKDLDAGVACVCETWFTNDKGKFSHTKRKWV